MDHPASAAPVSPGPASKLRRVLLARCEAYCARTGLAPSTLARRFLKTSASLFDRLRGDDDMRITTLDRVALRLDELEAALPADDHGDLDGGTTQGRRDGNGHAAPGE